MAAGLKPAKMFADLDVILLLGFFAGAAFLAFACCGWNPFVQQASYGSGENPIWNSFIDSNPPQPNSRKLRMKHKWTYMGSHGVPGTVQQPGKDYMTGYPLTGHLIGRHVWAPGPEDTDEPLYQAFDAATNSVRNFRAHARLACLDLFTVQNSGDNVFRTQQLANCQSSAPHSAGPVTVDGSIRKVRVTV